MAETLLTARGLTKIYESKAGDVHALTDVDLEVQEGEVVVVRGPSGSGKTTLLNLLGGLDSPTSGTVVLSDGRELSALSEAELSEIRRTYLGFMFQSFGLIPVLSAAENVEVPLRMRKMDAKERLAIVTEVLDHVGLGAHTQQRPDELSGGQQQRVGIARALAAKPRVLLADEPTAQLDSRTAATIMELLLELAKSEKVGMVVATHDPVLSSQADRVLELRDGRIVQGT